MIQMALYRSISSLRDQIRRQLRCHVFRTNLAGTAVVYQRVATDGSTDQETIDLMNDPWVTILSTLADEANDQSDFRIGLSALNFEGPGHLFLFEELDVPPPHLRGFFKPIGVGETHDITRDNGLIQAMEGTEHH